MKRKVLMNLIPVGAISIITIVIGLQAWQKSQAAKPDYEDPSAIYVSRPSGQLPQTKEYRVQLVIDGDTILLENKERVRLCGIDAPERPQPFGRDSKANLEKLIPRDRVILVMEVGRDRFDRIVGEVFTKVDNSQEERYLNAEQIRSGLAYEYKQYSKSCPNRGILEASEERARAEKKGIWSANYQRPWDYRRSLR